MAACSLVARQSFATDCVSLPNSIVLTGSTAFQTAARAMGKQMAALATPITLIYENAPGQGSLDGATKIMTSPDLTSTSAQYTDTTGAALTCDFTTPMKADVGVSDAYWETFTTLGAKPATIKDVPGPIQAFHFIVPKGDATWGGASAGVITAPMAADIFGCGANANGMLGTPAHAFAAGNAGIFVRGASSGTQAVVSKAIGLDLSAFVGTSPAGTGSGSDNMRNNVSAGMAGVTIGFLAADNYDKNRGLAVGAGGVDALAFQAPHQNKAYFADSSATSTDKRNVRDGHYGIWGPEHFFFVVDGTGAATDAKAQTFVTAVNSTDYLTALAGARVIPQCAMKVTKSTDGGLLTPFTPADPCGCAFEALATGVAAPADCTACTDNTACAASGKTCHHNFCE
ncbi:MAG TPA: hypothetical protein VH560_14370 [Polyangia bacterium]|nr:hypothetical protein [Polyangia bacterium]